MTHTVVLFDGTCNLCNGAVDFIIRRDARGVFRFAALQDEAAARRLRDSGLRRPYPDSLVLIDGGRTYVYSDAILRIAGKMGFPWSLAVLAYAIPRGLRDAAYRRLASGRYGWFGRRETCRIPSAEERGRFLSQ